MLKRAFCILLAGLILAVLGLPGFLVRHFGDTPDFMVGLLTGGVFLLWVWLSIVLENLINQKGW